MPLTNTKDRKVDCRCGASFKTHADFYGHVGDCPLTRCCLCLVVLGKPPYDNPVTHKCALIQLLEIQGQLRSPHV